MVVRALALTLVALAVLAPDAAAQERPDPRADALRRALDGRVTVHFDRLDLAACLDFLHEAAGIDLSVSPAARAAADGRVVSLRLRDVTLASCLTLVLGQVDPELRWTVARGVVRVEVRRERRAETRVAVHDVSDVVHAPPDFEAPRLGLDGLTWGSPRRERGCLVWVGPRR
ncbi:MAG: hypothetical protein KF878_05280 [Planctomycetes bacterium]|nr:hypothetical protein [Planctomycetota bacterium]